MIKGLIENIPQTNDRKVFSYMKIRFVNKSQAMSSESKLLEKVQNKKAQKTLQRISEI